MFRRIPWTCAAILILANISAAQDKPAEKPALVIEPGGHSYAPLGQEPGEGQLGRRHLLRGGDLLDPVDKLVMRGQSLKM